MDLNSYSSFRESEICEEIFCSTSICTSKTLPKAGADQLARIGIERANLINFENVKMKLLSPEFEGKYSSNEVDQYISLYREFLAIHFAYKSMDIVPTKLIDLIWHQHILDTRAYARDCDFLFGYFLHHYPYFGLNGPEDARNLAAAFQNTCEIWKVHFGRSPMSQSSDCSSCGGGSCSSCR
jgi:hypothetical protein